MRIRRSNTRTAQISLVSMIDVLMILLIFFMVTSTYLNLGMIPMAEQRDDPAPQTVAPQSVAPAPSGGTLLIRLGPDGVARVRGQPQTPQALTALFAAHLATSPAAPVMVLPSGNASAQSLVTVLDLATLSGVQTLRILRLEARP
ncbi:MAG: biopolymer transporter ExbD [Pseudomonadota bacterium]